MKNLAGLPFVAACGLILSFGVWTAADASPITIYTDRASFMSATANPTIVTFEGLAPVGGSTSYSTPSGLTVSGVNFVGRVTDEYPVYVLSVVNLTLPRVDYGSGAVLWGPRTGDPRFDGITATLPSGVTAVGSGVMALFDGMFTPPGQAVVVTLADGTSQVLAAETLVRPNRGFIGFTSTMPIVSVRYIANGGTTGPSNYPLIDNFIFGHAAEVSAIPEPTTMILFGTGIAGVVGSIRRRRKAD